MQPEPLRFFISQNDPVSFNGAKFNQDVEKKRNEVKNIAGQLEVVSASLFSYSAASDKIDESHEKWVKELKPLKKQLTKCQTATNELYEQLPHLDPRACIPEAMQNIQWLSQQVRFTKTRLKNLRSALKSPAYAGAVKAYKAITKSYEEYSEKEKKPASRLNKLNELFDDWIQTIRTQQEAISSLKSAFLMSRVNSLHLEFVNFFRELESSIDSSSPNALAKKISQLKLSEDPELDKDEIIYEDDLPSDYFEENTGKLSFREIFDIIEPGSSSVSVPPSPRIQIDNAALCGEITNLVSRFSKEELNQEFRFKNVDGFLQSCYLFAYPKIEASIKELEEVAKVFQGLQCELQHRISLICKGLPSFRENCDSLAMESCLYQEILSLQYKKLCETRKKLYAQGLEDGVRNGLYYVSRLFAAYHDTKELHLFFSNLIEEKNLSVFSTEKIVFTCIGTLVSTSVYFQTLCFSAQAVIDAHSMSYDDNCTGKFIHQILNSLQKTVAQLGRKSFETRADFQPFWKVISENGSLDLFRKSSESKTELPESIKVFLEKEMTRQLHFTRESFVELDLILFSLYYNQNYKTLLEASLKKPGFPEIYNSYKMYMIDEETLERFYLILTNLNHRNKLGSFENYIGYLRSSVLMECFNKTKNPRIVKLVEKAKGEQLTTQNMNNFPVFSPMEMPRLSLSAEHVSQKGFFDRLQTLLANAYWGENQEQAVTTLKKFLASFSSTSLSMPLTGHLSLLLGIFVVNLQLKENCQCKFSSDFEKMIFNEMCQGYIKTPAISLALRQFFGIPTCELLLYKCLDDNLTSLLQQYRGIVGFKIWQNLVGQYNENSLTDINLEPYKKSTLGYYKTEIFAILEAAQTALTPK